MKLDYNEFVQELTINIERFKNNNIDDWEKYYVQINKDYKKKIGIETPFTCAGMYVICVDMYSEYNIVANFDANKQYFLKKYREKDFEILNKYSKEQLINAIIDCDSFDFNLYDIIDKIKEWENERRIHIYNTWIRKRNLEKV